MNAAKILILIIGTVASVVVTLLMRFPSLRRQQYSNFRAHSWAGSIIVGLLFFLVFIVMSILQP